MENPDEERACFCALNRIFGFEPKIGIGLVKAFGGASAVFRQPGKEISDALGAYSRTRYAPLITGSAFESAAIELESLAADGYRFIAMGEPGYPKLLMECDDPPLGLYYKGTNPPEEVFDRMPQVAIVGTRSLSSYGRDWCQRIVAALSKASIRPMVVSGLAIGVDVTAHVSAIGSNLPTVAVMATGIDGLYPPSNRKVGEIIASREGCALVTDYPPGTKAIQINFLRRNRIIAGICQATILVESKIRGGGMMTARLAESYDRDVFALPGRIDDPLSQGCNLLIRENVAEPIGNLQDLVERLGLGKTDIKLKEDYKAEVAGFYADLPPAEQEEILKVALAIKSNRGVSMDELCFKLKRTFSHVSRLVTTLECDGFVSVDLLQHCSARAVKH